MTNQKHLSKSETELMDKIIKEALEEVNQEDFSPNVFDDKWLDYAKQNSRRVEQSFQNQSESESIGSLSRLYNVFSKPYIDFLNVQIALLKAKSELEKAEIYSRPLEINPGEGSSLIQQCKNLIGQIELIFKSEEICLLKNAIDTTLTEEQERTIEKELYKYSRWESLIRKMEDQIRYIKYETNWKSPSDFSELRELGTTVQRTRNHDGEELRALEKLDKLYEWKHYYELRKSVVDTALSLMPDDCITLCKERYFKRKRMKQCIQAIVAMTEWQYKQNIRKIKQISAPFLLLVNSAVKPPQKS